MVVHYENSNTIFHKFPRNKITRQKMVAYNTDVMLFLNLFLETNNMTMQSRNLSEIGFSIFYYN